MKLTAARVANRAKREVIHRIPAVRRQVEAKRTAMERAHRPHLPSISAQHQDFVQQVRQDGIVVTRWDAMGLPGVEELKPLLLELASNLTDRSPQAHSSAFISRDEMLEDTALYQWGLQPAVLDVVENYLGVPPHYYGPLVRRDCGDGREVDTRHWHRDIEDHRMLKMLIWLNDVDIDGGPFTYVRRDASTDAARRLRYVSGFVETDRFADVVPREHWRAATGPQWTVGAPDTSQVFHRAAPPVARDRYSVTFTWMTRRPLATMPAVPWRRDQVQRVVTGLDPRQIACLPPALTA